MVREDLKTCIKKVREKSDREFNNFSPNYLAAADILAFLSDWSCWNIFLFLILLTQYYYKLMLIIEKKMYAQKLENIYIFIEQLGMYISRK